MNLRFSLSILFVTLTSVSGAFAATIASADTTLRVEATDGDPAALTLTSLSGATGAAWTPAAPVSLPLIRSATVDGRSVALQWHLAPARDGERTATRQVFTFLCRDPALELTSTWTATGPEEGGPIEHEIVLTNRGTREVLLPLQPTLTLESLIPQGGGCAKWWSGKRSSW